MKKLVVSILAVVFLASTSSFADSSTFNKKCKMLDQSLAGDYTGLTQVRIENGTRVVSEISSDVKIKRIKAGAFQYIETGIEFGNPLPTTETFNVELVDQGDTCILNFTDLNSTAILIKANGTRSYTFQSSADKKSFLHLVRK